MGLALAAIVKGYKLICVTTDKQSKEKIDILKAVGAKVIICPTNVEPDDPKSKYSTAKRIGDETESSWNVNQYYNDFENKGYDVTISEFKCNDLVISTGTE